MKYSDCEPYELVDSAIEVALNITEEDELDLMRSITSFLCNEGLLDYDMVKDYVWENFDWEEKEDDDQE